MTISAISTSSAKMPSSSADFLRRALESGVSRGSVAVISVPAPLAPLEALIEALPSEDSLLWSPPEGPSFSAAGAAETLWSAGQGRGDQIRRLAGALFSRIETITLGEDAPPPPRCFGGFSFQPGWASSEPWAAFGDARFVLPRFRYARQGDRAFLSVAVSAEVAASEAERAALLAASESLLRALGAAPSRRPADLARTPPRTVTHRSEISEERWRSLVQTIVQRIGVGDFEKVVIARRTSLSFDGPLDVTGVLRELSETSEHCTRFALRFGKVTFLGATPERLIRRAGLIIDTEALAGSSDAARAIEMMESPKEREEHELVVREIVKCLSPLCATLNHSAVPEVRALRHLLHLTTPIRGRLARPVHVLDLALRLHPTPAVGGVPAAEAMRFIIEHEPVERGWYASPIGWFDASGDGEFAVGLRSGALVGDRAYLYAGGGIVRDSDPGSEYAETRLKLAALSAALHVAQ